MLAVLPLLATGPGASGGAEHAAATWAETLAALGKPAAARQVLTEAKGTRPSQNPWILLAVDVAEARLLAAEGRQEPALAKVEAALAEASERGFRQLAFEARLARAKIGGAERRADDLKALVEDARRAGYEEIARRAEVLQGGASTPAR